MTTLRRRYRDIPQFLGKDGRLHNLRSGNDSDSDSESDTEVQAIIHSPEMRKKRALGLIYMYIALVVILGFLTLWINLHSYRQVEKLKEKFGQTVKKGAGHEWWRNAVIYQIYPPSFQDSDGDGIGDLDGISQRVDYLQQLGVGAILLTPIYKSSVRSFGHDIEDHKAINPMLGTLQQFAHLIKVMHEKGIKVILDLVPNHTSSKHPWFQESRKGGKDNPYKDFYIWHRGTVLRNGTIKAPSNWRSKTGGSAWQWDNVRQEFYLHQFEKFMPDLNFRNEKVQQEFQKTMAFWLDHDVDGFRILDMHLLFEAEEVILDEPWFAEPGKAFDDPEILEHIYTDDQPEIHEISASWREYLDDYMSKKKKHGYFMVEAVDDSVKDIVKYYFTGPDAPVNMNLMQVDENCDGNCLQLAVDTWMGEVPEGRVTHWMISNYNTGRLSGRKGVKFVNALNVVLLTLPSTAIAFYGDEIGMADVNVYDKASQNPLIYKTLFKNCTSGSCRGLMQWTKDRNGGFSAAEKTWMPVHETYSTVNVQVQNDEINSQLQIFQRMSKLRKDPIFQYGKLTFAVVNENIFSFVRTLDSKGSYLVSVNIGKKISTDDYMQVTGFTDGKVILHSGNPKMEGQTVSMNSIVLEPGEAVVVESYLDTFEIIMD